MDTKIYCEGAKCAKVAINFPGQSPIILHTKNPPVKFVGVTIKNLYVSANKDHLIDLEMPFAIATLRWVSNNPSYTGGTCPQTPEEGMLFSGNKLNIYSVNQEVSFLKGQCIYEVRFTGQRKIIAQFSDQIGEFYSIESDENSFNYLVECDRCCGDDEYLLDSSNYPGWKCVPMPPIANRLGEMQNQIKKL